MRSTIETTERDMSKPTSTVFSQAVFSRNVLGFTRRRQHRPMVCCRFTGLTVVTCMVLSAATLGHTRLLAASPDRPNILLILTDDQGWPTLGCYGGERVATPHLDQLAAEGARFTDAYVTSQCTPTRATLLTGQYTARHGLWHVLGWYGYPWARMTEPPFAENYSRDTFTIAKGLRSAGYATGIMGKWHLTNNQDGNYMGLNPTAASHYGFTDAGPVLTKDAFLPGADRGVDALTDQAIDFIRRNRDQPWFCFLSHHMIHGNVVAPPELERKYRKQGYGDEGPYRAVYLAGLEHIDHSIGRLMSSLQRMGESDETLVLFLSDNGGIDHRYRFQELAQPHPERPRFQPDMKEYDNAPLRAGKGSIYEGGVRVPMLARWPGKIPKNMVIETPVHAVDLLSTALDLAGASSPPKHHVDGRSLKQLLLRGRDASLDDRALFQYSPFYDLRWGLTPAASIRRGDYKLIEFFGDRVDSDGTYVPGHRLELYHLKTDLGETHDLAHSHPLLARRLRNELHQWMQSVGAVPSVENQHHAPDRAFTETREKPPWQPPPRTFPNE